MAKDDKPQSELFPIIEHKVGFVPIDQRAFDGYVNGTALCQASGKHLNDYIRLKSTTEFLVELRRSTGIPVDQLVQIINTGPNKNRGTWVHPHVAINLGQWASPRFAVLVSTWVFDWMHGKEAANYKFPYHIRRYLINRSKIPETHFSMLDQMTLRLLASLEDKGYIIPLKIMPDISMGRMFSKYIRDAGYDPDSFPTYRHVFDDGKRQPVEARLYPNELMTSFNLQLSEWIRGGKALEYFRERDADAIAPIKTVIAALPPPTQDNKFNKKLRKAIAHNPKD